MQKASFPTAVLAVVLILVAGSNPAAATPKGQRIAINDTTGPYNPTPPVEWPRR
jgi:hypothetical protein